MHGKRWLIDESLDGSNGQRQRGILLRMVPKAVCQSHPRLVPPGTS